MKKIALSEAVGKKLGYDITEISRSNNFKGVAFKRGHIIQESDLSILQRLGKNHIYIWEDHGDEVHEDTAALLMAPKIAGENIHFDDEPSEGKVSFFATTKGIFKVDKDRLEQINALEIPSLPTIHNNFPVTSNKQVAAFRIIPLTCRREIIDQMAALLDQPLISVTPFIIRSAAILVTGNEVYTGKITDAFTPTLTAKMKRFGVEIKYSRILPDSKPDISQAIREATKQSELILVSGGTSVDPDDVTVAAMKEAGVLFHHQGNPIQPGNNLTIGKVGEVTVCAVPAAALFYDKTALDIFLPRLLAGEAISSREIAKSGHGGLCHFCPTCHYPICPFGWGSS
ncbi:MAG: molybdopterin-binding protein [Desulfuromusa sp.]